MVGLRLGSPPMSSLPIVLAIPPDGGAGIAIPPPYSWESEILTGSHPRVSAIEIKRKKQNDLCLE